SVGAVTRVRILEYLDGLGSCGLSEASVARTAGAISSFCAGGVGQGLLNANPSTHLVFRPGPGDQPPGRSVSDVKAVLTAKKNCSWFPERDHLVIDLLSRYALRPSEIVGLNSDDINAEERVIRVQGVRVLELHEETKGILREYLAQRSLLK